MRYCPKCGAECEDNASFCSICGEKLPASGYRPENKFEENKTNSTSYNNNYEENRPTDTAKTLGILSLVFGIIGINLVGLICGIVGLNKNPDSSARSLCIVGIAISAIHMLVQVIIIILAATGIISSYFYI